MEVLWMIVLTVGLLGSHCEGAISCKNEDDKDVDWFILYKVKNGFNYVYTDSTNQNLRKNNKHVNNQAGVLANTLKPYFEKDTQSSEFGFIAYNDQPPTSNSVSSTHGHSKGFVMIDKENVVWLLHSTPNFPSCRESNKFYPNSGKCNAQIFMCVTLNSTESAEIAQHLKDINAYKFEEHNADNLTDSSTAPRARPYNKDLRSAGNSLFKRFVKQTSATRDPKVGDLYVTIADTLNTNLYIQTWRSDRGEPFVTRKGKELVTIMSVDTAAGKWDHGSDHSKWCVSETQDWMCVGDSNREPSQFERPGGALCIKSQPVAEKFREIKKLVKIDTAGATAGATAGDIDCGTESDTGPPPKKPKVHG
ncbi:deoxyribonuclease-2-alpha isoform X2 [Maylandia zebra]|uniref:deoxyribonuclease-2-alpha isoform X2 n=1 Tax=Maylandia zebra TaxID=106582 RepID=UPI00403C6D9E